MLGKRVEAGGAMLETVVESKEHRSDFSPPPGTLRGIAIRFLPICAQN